MKNLIKAVAVAVTLLMAWSSVTFAVFEREVLPNTDGGSSSGSNYVNTGTNTGAPTIADAQEELIGAFGGFISYTFSAGGTVLSKTMPSGPGATQTINFFNGGMTITEKVDGTATTVTTYRMDTATNRYLMSTKKNADGSGDTDVTYWTYPAGALAGATIITSRSFPEGTAIMPRTQEEAIAQHYVDPITNSNTSMEREINLALQRGTSNTGQGTSAWYLMSGFTGFSITGVNNGNKDAVKELASALLEGVVANGADAGDYYSGMMNAINNMNSADTFSWSGFSANDYGSMSVTSNTSEDYTCTFATMGQ